MHAPALAPLRSPIVGRRTLCEIAKALQENVRLAHGCVIQESSFWRALDRASNGFTPHHFHAHRSDYIVRTGTMTTSRRRQLNCGAPHTTQQLLPSRSFRVPKHIAFGRAPIVDTICKRQESPTSRGGMHLHVRCASREPFSSSI